MGVCGWPNYVGPWNGNFGISKNDDRKSNHLQLDPISCPSPPLRSGVACRKDSNVQCLGFPNYWWIPFPVYCSDVSAIPPPIIAQISSSARFPPWGFAGHVHNCHCHPLAKIFSLSKSPKSFAEQQLLMGTWSDLAKPHRYNTGFKHAPPYLYMKYY